MMKNFNVGVKAGIWLVLLSGATMDILSLTGKTIPDFLAWSLSAGIIIAIGSSFIKQKPNERNL
jgi:hypothetical protein